MQALREQEKSSESCKTQTRNTTVLIASACASKGACQFFAAIIALDSESRTEAETVDSVEPGMGSTANCLTITQADDFHLHVRDGAALRSVVPHAARQFRRAIIMPNLKPPVTSVQQVNSVTSLFS